MCRAHDPPGAYRSRSVSTWELGWPPSTCLDEPVRSSSLCPTTPVKTHHPAVWPNVAPRQRLLPREPRAGHINCADGFRLLQSPEHDLELGVAGFLAGILMEGHAQYLEVDTQVLGSAAQEL